MNDDALMQGCMDATRDFKFRQNNSTTTLNRKVRGEIKKHKSDVYEIST